MSGTSSRPLLLVVSAPSGAGKTTLCQRLLADFPSMRYSVSCTTRMPRAGEVDGVHYHFLDAAAFQQRVEAGDFLEYAQVHGNRYGTLREEVLRGLLAGQDVLMDIDVQGAAHIREALRQVTPDDPLRAGFVDVFVHPPSVEELRRRLCRRGKDSPEVIERRVRQAEAEIAEAGAYRYSLVNDDLDRAYGLLRDLVVAEHRRPAGGVKDPVREDRDGMQAV